MSYEVEADGVTKRFGGILASDNISLDVKQGELHAIIGPNGAGKTTLIGQLTGMLTPERREHPHAVITLREDEMQRGTLGGAAA